MKLQYFTRKVFPKFLFGGVGLESSVSGGDPKFIFIPPLILLAIEVWRNSHPTFPIK